jgi:hypothetical protein
VCRTEPPFCNAWTPAHRVVIFDATMTATVAPDATHDMRATRTVASTAGATVSIAASFDSLTARNIAPERATCARRGLCSGTLGCLVWFAAVWLMRASVRKLCCTAAFARRFSLLTESARSTRIW